MKAKSKPRRVREKSTPYITASRPSLTRKESSAIAEFRSRLHQILRDDQIKSLVLFGSKARGDAHRGSDVDLFLLHEQLSREQREQVEELEFDLLTSGQPHSPIHVLDHSIDEIAKDVNLGIPLFVNIAREGKILEGGPIIVNQTNKHVVSQEYLRSAMERLRSAEALIQIDSFRDSISRSYYAVLDAADAALIAKGFTPKSHSGSITLFGVHFIKKGLVDKKYGRVFNRIEEARDQADYRRVDVFTKDDAEYWFNVAREFVSEIENLLPKLLEEK